VEYVKFLIFNDADVDALDYDGKTALCIAAERGWFKGVQALMETPVPKKLHQRNVTSSLILKAGSKFGIVKVIAEEIAQFVIRVSADPTVNSKKSFWPSERATESEKSVKDKTVVIAKSGSATPSESDDEEEDTSYSTVRDYTEDGTALGLARENNHTDILEYLSRLT